ncbi:hypothetical protein EW093_00775 [Thiospirochaeta perfilievii]|uniref:Helicase C-terminal domain-containing protein n=1 Tax=Thiospirochaeta perfilievii TaxID=252967 RepID=A0A5C1Q7K6_9SPIO|nr:helicase C-terminal domain-containing protein [Thiospirochaeta perfilievii]QEN03298.1 hypothetical protein EW093_00775 [Thiospirochaeta perfilievii]
MTLTDFQNSTVKEALIHLERSKRYLIADEVGLGKTVVARGILQQLYEKKADGNLHVVYICSNQVLAQQNIKKLDFTNSKTSNMYNRLMLMVCKQEKVSGLQISTLTPNTSLRMTKSFGIANERVLLYKILSTYSCIKHSNSRMINLCKLLQGDCDKKNWKIHLKTEIHLKPGLKNIILQKIIDSKLMRTILKFLDEYDNSLSRNYVVELRKVVTDVAIEECLNADIFILDEFQKFNELITSKDGDNSRISEIQQTAMKVFSSDKKILLLSATPFKSFSTQLDKENGDDHFEAFQKVLDFILENSEKEIGYRIVELRNKYFEYLSKNRDDLNPLLENDDFQNVRNLLIGEYLKCLTRTERSIVVNTPLINEDSSKKLIPTNNEVFNSIEISKWLNKEHKTSKFSHQLIEFCKSVPFPFSFLHGYKLKDTKRGLDSFYLGYKKWNNYTYSFAGQNSKFDLLSDNVFSEDSDNLLWIPASIPYYETDYINRNTKCYSKSLIFSSWKMVPRAISALLSYEAEHKFIPTNSNYKYFKKENNKKQPGPRLVFRTVKNNSDDSINSFSNATLLYPCKYLVYLLNFNDIRNVKLKDFICKIKNEIKKELPLNNKSYSNLSKHWYWDSLFQLDSCEEHSFSIEQWLEGAWLDSISDEEVEDIESTKQKGKRQFLEHLKSNISETNNFNTDAPSDIYDTLSLISLGSPAVCVYRTLIKLFPEFDLYVLQDYATKIALGFFTLFNKSESILVIDRLFKEKNEPYWKKCLYYCTENNIQAMIDEYLFLLKSNSGSIEDDKIIDEICEQFITSLTIRSNTVEVDFDKEEKVKVRCHFAMEYGTQKIETDKGRDRMISIRDVFNSPFRPFVLTTTSVGQEGLDFHHYCRNIYHWNLPNNPIDIEQREGRVNRYLSHAIRLNFKELIGNKSFDNWNDVLEEVKKITLGSKLCDLEPMWHINSANKYKINRYTPLHYFSKDNDKYEYFLKVLAIYRLSFGQPNQEQFLSTFTNKMDLTEDELRIILNSVSITLSPILKDINVKKIKEQ